MQRVDELIEEGKSYVTAGERFVDALIRDGWESPLLPTLSSDAIEEDRLAKLDEQEDLIEKAREQALVLKRY